MEWRMSHFAGGDTVRWGNVWFKRLPVSEQRVSKNRADVTTTTTWALIINEGSANAMWEHCQHREQWLIMWCTDLKFPITFTPQYHFERMNLYPFWWKNTLLHIIVGLRADAYISGFNIFIWERCNIRNNRQRKAAEILHLCQLLFNNASVLQRDWLLFGALCCQHLAGRAQHVAGKDSQCKLRGLKVLGCLMCSL